MQLIDELQNQSPDNWAIDSAISDYYVLRKQCTAKGDTE